MREAPCYSLCFIPFRYLFTCYLFIFLLFYLYQMMPPRFLLPLTLVSSKRECETSETGIILLFYLFTFLLLNRVFRKVGESHIALAEEGVVESECCTH